MWGYTCPIYTRPSISVKDFHLFLSLSIKSFWVDSIDLRSKKNDTKHSTTALPIQGSVLSRSFPLQDQCPSICPNSAHVQQICSTALTAPSKAKNLSLSSRNFRMWTGRSWEIKYPGKIWNQAFLKKKYQWILK